jgi:hypothetical protein
MVRLNLAAEPYDNAALAAASIKNFLTENSFYSYRVWNIRERKSGYIKYVQYTFCRVYG